MILDLSAQQLLMLGQALPHGPLRLICLWLSQSKGGQHSVYPTAAWCCSQLGMSESSYHRWRGWLEAAGLVRIVRRKTAPAYNLPNLVKTLSLKALMRWAWAQRGKLVRLGKNRKGVTDGSETPKPNSKRSLPPKNLFKPVPTAERQRIREAYGMTAEALAAIPNRKKWA